MCYPKAFPAALTLSSTDVSKTDPQWHCDELKTETLLELGPHLLYYLTRVLDWLGV